MSILHAAFNRMRYIPHRWVGYGAGGRALCHVWGGSGMGYVGQPKRSGLIHLGWHAGMVVVGMPAGQAGTTGMWHRQGPAVRVNRSAARHEWCHCQQANGEQQNQEPGCRTGQRRARVNVVRRTEGWGIVCTEGRRAVCAAQQNAARVRTMRPASVLWAKMSTRE